VRAAYEEIERSNHDNPDGSPKGTLKKWFVIYVNLKPDTVNRYWYITLTEISITVISKISNQYVKTAP